MWYRVILIGILVSSRARKNAGKMPFEYSGQASATNAFRVVVWLAGGAAVKS